MFLDLKEFQHLHSGILLHPDTDPKVQKITALMLEYPPRFKVIMVSLESIDKMNVPKEMEKTKQAPLNQLCPLLISGIRDMVYR